MRNLLVNLTDKELTMSLKALVKAERGRSVDILKHLNEMDRRRLAERTGFPSLFDYCVRELRYVNGTAARLIHAARAAKKYPILYKTLERGLLSVTTASMLAGHLKWDNHRRLIRAAAGKSAREVEALVASLTPVPKAPAERMRFIAVAMPAAAPAAVPAPPSAEPAAPVAEVVPPAPPELRVVFSFTGGEALLRDVERVKELSRHKWPAGRLEDVFAGAIKVLLARIDPDKRIQRRERARRILAGARSRRIPASVRDEVWRRDGGRCAFESSEGRACGSRSVLEFDHIRPWAMGGSGATANIRLLCRSHNQTEARRIFGGAAIDAAVARRRAVLRSEVKI